jgi:recombination protein RecT
MGNSEEMKDIKFYESIESKWLAQGMDKASFEKEVSFAVQIINGNSYMQKCEPKTALKAVMNVCQTGLTLNPVMKYAYLVPRKIGGVLSVCLDPSYQGLIHLLTSSGAVKSISSQIIYQNDLIEIDLASDKKVLKHVPYWMDGKDDSGQIMGVYSLAQLEHSFHCEIMTIQDVYEIRDHSESYKAYLKNKNVPSIWVSDEPEMIRKTVVKRHFKYLPKGKKAEQISNAIQLDNLASGYDEIADFHDIIQLEEYLEQCGIENDRLYNDYKMQINTVKTRNQAQALFNELRAYERPSAQMNQTEAAKQAKKAVQISDQKELKL